MASEASLPRKTRERLAELGVRPTRRLGQNFLVDRRVAVRIADQAGIEGRTVLEIGPGVGALTEELLRRARRLVLVEVDSRLAQDLVARYSSDGRVRVVAADALEADLAALVPASERAIVVSNLPYAVASPILVRLLDAQRAFERLVLMLQREVAERIVAPPGGRDYGLLAVWTALRGDGRILFRVPPGAFRPRPKVESAVVSIRLDESLRVPVADLARFRAVVRAAFGTRRKMLRSALAGLVDEAAFAAAGIDSRRRGETLSVAEFASLSAA